MSDEILEALHAHDIVRVRKLLNEKDKNVPIVFLPSRTRLNERVCSYCGEKFQPIRTNQKYCCHKCRDAAGNKVKRERKRSEVKPNELIVAVCKECGRKFLWKSNTKEFCSTQCYHKWHASPRPNKQYAVPADMEGECERCSRPAEPGQRLCKHHIELAKRKAAIGE